MAFGSLPSVLGSGGGTAYSLIGGTGLFADGTAAAPSISFASQTGLGVYRVGSGILGFVSGGGGLTLNLTTGTPKFSAFNYAASIAIQDAVNGNITLTPSGTGVVQSGDGTSVGQVTNRTSVSGTGVAALSLIRLGAEDLQLRNSAGNLSFWRDTAEFARFNASNRFLLGTTTDSGNGILQLGTHTTSAGGIGFGTEFSVFRQSATQITIGNAGQEIVSFYKVGAGMKLEVNGGSVANPQITANGDSDTGIYWALANDLRLVTGGVSALTLDGSQNATFAGTVKPQLATTAGAPAYVKGAIYFDTTLNKLRVGGAAAWETITSV